MGAEEVYIYDSHEELVSSMHAANRPVADLVREIQNIYLADSRPWVVGFSGGKDSTVILSLTYIAIFLLPVEQRTKHVYVVSSDTLVETPVVVDMIKASLAAVNDSSLANCMPISAHAVMPKKDNTFWVNLLGRGYPAPTRSFRWCTERMKINPVSEFILDKVASFGEVVVVLGSRSQESSSRAQVIAKHKIDGSALSRHSSLPNAYTYMPIEAWSSDEVWEYLMSAPRPWGGSNRVLFELYKGSNAGECPLVIDTSTPSCGNSRFGCWTCTVVTHDKAIEGLIQSGDTWMQPLLDFRNLLHFSSLPENKAKYRNHRRRTGKVTFARSEDIENDDEKTAKHVPGPYLMAYRREWLQRLLEIEKSLNDSGHEIELITRSELQYIRQQWLCDPNEPDWKDSVPKIFSDVYPNEEINWIKNDAGAFTAPDEMLLEELSSPRGISSSMIMRLIDTELSYMGLSKRSGILNKIESVLDQDWEDLEVVSKRKSEPRSSTYYTDEANAMKNLIERLTQ
ncbi:DNA phosphorothioation system sulfurtransferase DndC [Pseudomonas sp. R4-83]|uniref:DNA phosphorothioation system sulfurtransferase DndC n=1 Tax=unclassified Pseudomonas TaxID=196821 RepID=UPI003DA9C58B